EGKVDRENNVLKNAPHTATVVMDDDWNRPYSRAKAAFPLPFVRDNKFWPSVSRIDNAYGDRNLFCSCLPVESFNESVPAEVVAMHKLLLIASFVLVSIAASAQRSTYSGFPSLVWPKLYDITFVESE